MPEYEYQGDGCNNTFPLHRTITRPDNAVPPTRPLGGDTNVAQMLFQLTVTTSKRA